MSEEDFDVVYETCDKLYNQIHELVNKATEGLKPEVEELIRTKMTEDFRFWKPL